jgi:hypothetical protein
MTADDVVTGDVGPKVSFSIKTGARAQTLWGQNKEI